MKCAADQKGAMDALSVVCVKERALEPLTASFEIEGRRGMEAEQTVKPARFRV